MVGQRVRDLLPQLTVLNNRQLALGKERRELRKRHFEEKRSTKKEVTAKKPGKDTQAASIQNKGSGKSKLQKDVYTTAIVFPEEINMQEELEMITKAAREAYEAHFPGEGGL